MFEDIYKGSRVLITGHTGFKGSWLALWLKQLGAEVTGYSLPPPTEPNHFNLLDLDVSSCIGDIRDTRQVEQLFCNQKPEIVFHLAAQPLVRLSYQKPIETFSTNVMGTINVLEAARRCETVRAVVHISSDKCYENKDWPWGYRETDPLGGFDPYSASKGCAEIITSCWRSSFFRSNNNSTSQPILLASVRAGNVIGGGDWAMDRLVPDLMRSIDQNQTVKLRNPQAVRPWQHVLEPLSGYLLVGQKLLQGKKELAEAWNFGPTADGNISVMALTQGVKEIWPKLEFKCEECLAELPETQALRLDHSKARITLEWEPVWSVRAAIEKTVEWYQAYYERGEVESLKHLDSYIATAKSRQIPWAKR